MEAADIIPGLVGASALADAARRRRLSLVEAEPPYPRISVIGGEWCRQNAPGGRWWPLTPQELRALLKLEEAA